MKRTRKLRAEQEGAKRRKLSASPAPPRHAHYAKYPSRAAAAAYNGARTLVLAARTPCCLGLKLQAVPGLDPLPPCPNSLPPLPHLDPHPHPRP